MKKQFFFRLFFGSLLIWIVIRGGIYLLPGDPAEFLAHESLVPIETSELRKDMALDVPITKRLVTLPANQSLIHHTKASELIIPSFKNTIKLAALALIFSIFFTLISLYFSFISPKFEAAAQMGSVALASLPISVLGPILILLICVKIPLFPITKSPWLPAICLALHLSAFWYRALQKKISNFLPSSAVLGARSRGLPEHKVFLNYLFVPVLGSIASYLGTQLGTLLNGSVLIEVIFQWNGLGALLLKSVKQRDYPIIEITLLITTLLAVLSQQLGYWFQAKIGVDSER